VRIRVLIPLAATAVVLAGCGGASSPTTSTAVATVNMPAVTGLTQQAALKRFSGLRITVYVYPERNPRIPKGFVFRQTPGPGPVAKGTLSALYVSAGPHGPRVGKPFVAHR